MKRTEIYFKINLNKFIYLSEMVFSFLFSFKAYFTFLLFYLIIKKYEITFYSICQYQNIINTDLFKTIFIANFLAGSLPTSMAFELLFLNVLCFWGSLPISFNLCFLALLSVSFLFCFCVSLAVFSTPIMRFLTFLLCVCVSFSFLLCF